MGKPIFLSEEDAAIIQRLLDREKHRVPDPKKPDIPPPNEAGPTVCVVKVPDEGFSAMVEDTGTDDGTAYDNLGTGYGSVYRAYDGTDGPILVPVGQSKHVYNIGDSAITPDDSKYVIAHRDGFGKLYTQKGGSGGAQIISFIIQSNGTFVGGITDPTCLHVQAEVVNISCGGSGVAVGDEVTIWDPAGCFFNVPVDILLYMQGMAVKMAWDDTNPYGICHPAAPPPVEPVEGECWWKVISLSCIENIYDEPSEQE